MILTCSTRISGLRVTRSTALFGMVVMVVVAQEAGDTVVVVVTGVVVLMVKSTICFTVSLTIALNPAEISEAGLAVSVMFCMAGLAVTATSWSPTEWMGAVVFWASTPSNMEDGR